MQNLYLGLFIELLSGGETSCRDYIAYLIPNKRYGMIYNDSRGIQEEVPCFERVTVFVLKTEKPTKRLSNRPIRVPDGTGQLLHAKLKYQLDEGSSVEMRETSVCMYDSTPRTIGWHTCFIFKRSQVHISTQR
jgi:hypothetical protein